MGKTVAQGMVAVLLVSAFLAGWCYTNAVVGSGWLVFFALISARGMLNRLEGTVLGGVSVLLAVEFVAAWYLTSAVSGSGWLLLGAFFAIYGVFDGLYSGTTSDQVPANGDSTDAQKAPDKKE